VVFTESELPVVDSNSYVPQPPPHGYYQPPSETPSPYLNKRTPVSNIYPDPQQSYSSPAVPYGNVPRKSSANQCKLHINCPSKRKKEENFIFINIFLFFLKVQEVELHLIFKDRLVCCFKRN